MTTINEEPYRSYRVPRAHRDWLIDPPLDANADALAENLRNAADWNLQIGGQSIASFRKRARHELIHTAIDYVSSYRDLPNICSSCSTDRPLVMAGHQPELFHPGVWFKNFVLSQLGQSLSTMAINLIVDNDICRARSIRVPTLRSGKPATETIAFDRPSAVVPYEMADIDDPEAFQTFGRRVARTIAPLVDNPCIEQLWPEAVQAADRTGNIGLSLAQSRHQIESQLGLSTLEVPLSRLCEGPAFCEFVLHLIRELPRLHDCYNESVVAYRIAHHIRSNSHPVPELACRDGWYEAPLWIYDETNRQRRALYARVSDQQIELSDLASTHLTISNHGDPTATAADLLERLQNNVRLRPRALVTTMYARLVLSDLFLHGIGGGKYDQLNDTIIRRFFDVAPPHFTVLSATFTPLGESLGSDDASSDQLRQSIRRTRFQPEHFADLADLPIDLVQEKRELLSDIPPRGDKQSWHDRITAINTDLSARLDDLRWQLADQLNQVNRREAQRRLLSSRDYSFCIYPLQEMGEMFAAIARGEANPHGQQEVATTPRHA
ncbi:hypothetical protein EC9_49500 [Rosistilla ulvae]|uniref:Uncharacterized protein n=1 Tax=Rosistilla ulvae TaxID=1930277 RepID=A0A517M773_9BACT|nr:hypothetical protein [Rosistilla ulvae]QDS90734.1 hypothetical protein EC9_49500 [Rosistilla ulvae]